MSRTLEFLLDSHWFMTRDYLDRMRAIAQRETDIEAVQRELGAPLRNTREVTVRNGVAIVPITGPIFRYANLFTRISGGTSTEQLATDLGTAVADPAVRRVLLDIDSPGGEANGISDTAKLIRELRNEKPIDAFVSGTGASGAYWLASAAERLFVSDTGLVGSVGAVLALRRGKDDSIVMVSSQSPKKVIDPDTEEGQAEIQAFLDSLAQVFIEAVAEYRGISVEKVLTDFGQGGVRLGAEAVALGMADEVTTLERLIQKIAHAGGRSAIPRLAAAGGITHTEDSMSDERQQKPAAEGQPEIDRAYLNANHTDLVAEIQAEAGATAAAAERERIEGVLSIAFDEAGKARPSAKGYEQLVLDAAAEEGTTKAEVALRIMNARDQKEAQAKAAHLAALKGDEKEAGVPAASADTGTEANEQLAALRQAETIRKGAPAPSRN